MLLISDMKWMAKAACQMLAFPLSSPRRKVVGVMSCLFFIRDYSVDEKREP